MADTKISALPSGSPVQATDILPIVRSGVNLRVPAGDIVGLSVTGLTTLGPNGSNYGLASYGWIQPPFANVPLLNLEQDVSTGLNTHADPSILFGIYGGIQPADANGNLFGVSCAVRDQASAFDVANIGAIGATSQWFGTTGKQAVFNYGVIGAAYALGPGNIRDNWGVRALATYGSEFSLSNVNGTGTITFNKGLTAGSGGYYGTITNDYSIFIEVPAAGATFTNPHIGLFISDQTNGGVLANALDISASGNSKLGFLSLGGYAVQDDGSRINLLGASKTFTGSPTRGVYTGAYIGPVFNLSTAPATAGYGAIANAVILAPTAADWTGKTLVGLLGQNTYHCTGAVGSLIGVQAQSITATGSGPVTSNIALEAKADNGSVNDGLSVNTIASQYAIFAQSRNSNTRVATTNNYGVFIDGPPNTANLITHNYGLYLADQTLGSGNTDPWAIYSVGGKSYLKGGLILESVAPTAAASQVAFGGTISATASAGGGQAIPATILGYLVANVAGTAVKIPYFSA